jgi:Cytochrome P450
MQCSLLDLRVSEVLCAVSTPRSGVSHCGPLATPHRPHTSEHYFISSVLSIHSMPSPQELLYGVTAGLLALILVTFLRRARKYKLPPLVKGGVPLLGNALQLPPTGHEAGEVVRKWADQYGEMYPARTTTAADGGRFTIKLGSATWVFLNSSRTVTELMDKRAAIYCSRPEFPMTQDIVSGGGRVVLMPYGERWRTLRKIMHQILSTRQTSTYRAYQDLESKQLLWDYLHTTDKWYLHNGRYSNSGTPVYCGVGC